jgi:hypothetical protein
MVHADATNEHDHLGTCDLNGEYQNVKKSVKVQRLACNPHKNRWQAPGAARSLRKNMPPITARGARHLKMFG